MKRITQSISILLAFLFILGSSDLMAQKRKDVVGKRTKTPFSQKRYKSDKKYFRAVGNAESSSVRISEQKARVNASGLLADQINTLVKKVATDYVNEYQVGDKMEFQSKFENQVMTVTNQVLAGATEMDSQLYTKKKRLKKRNAEGKKKIYVYNYYVVLQMNKVQFLLALDKAIGIDPQLSVDYNQQKFHSIFNEEMDKIALANGNTED